MLAPGKQYPLLHPVPLLALVTLVVNDHVLKQHYPGWITGKLSDIAGMVFFPLFLMAIANAAGGKHEPISMPRDRVLMACAFATALVFCAVKTFAPATALYEMGLGFLQWPLRAVIAMLRGDAPGPVTSVVLVRDVTDLIAVPFVAIPMLIGRSRPVTRNAPAQAR